jgi:hypothetical protein
MDYQGNSHKSKELKPSKEDKVVEKVVTGDVVVVKRTLGQKFKAVFFGGEFKSASRYLAADVILPSVRNLIVDMTTKGIERVVYGETTARRRPTNYGGRVQYNNPLRRPDRPYLPDQRPSSFSAPRRATNDLVLASREEAEVVLERLIDILDKYGVASLADLYDLTGLPSAHVDNKWGWTYLTNTEIRQIRDGYLLDLPPMEEI